MAALLARKVGTRAVYCWCGKQMGRLVPREKRTTLLEQLVFHAVTARAEQREILRRCVTDALLQRELMVHVERGAGPEYSRVQNERGVETANVAVQLFFF